MKKNKKDDEIIEFDVNTTFDRWDKEREIERATLCYKLCKRPFFAIKGFLENFTPRHLKWFFQKLFRGYSSSDLWNLDYAIAKKILPMLKAFHKMEKTSVPGIMFYDITNENYSDAEFDKARKRWDEVLDKIIFSFTFIVHENDEKYRKLLGIEYEEGSKWKYKKGSYEAAYEKHEEGIKFFAEHFRSLWD